MVEENVLDYIDESVDSSQIESWKIDAMIEQVKENNEDIKRYKEVLDNRIKELKHQYENKKQLIEKQNHYMLTTLREYALQQDNLKDAKTQKKYSSLNGDIVIKKSIPKVSKPEEDADVYDKIQLTYPEFVEKVENRKVNWKDLKKKFVIQDNRIFDQETGEEVTSLFNIEVNDESVEVK